MKKNILRICALLSLLEPLSSCWQTQREDVSSSYIEMASTKDHFIDSLLQQMTWEEKIGQLNLHTSNWNLKEPTLSAEYRLQVKAGRAGGLFNAHSVAFTKKMQQIAVEESRLGIPLIFGFDIIHGYKTIFPIPLGEAASWDIDLIKKAAEAMAEESSAAGIHWTFAPVVDISRDPRWGRVAEGAGEDTYLCSRIAEAKIEGFQGGDLSQKNTLLACAKHFAAYGAVEGGRDYNTVDVSERALWETYLPPFEASVKAGVGSFMTAFNEVNALPATANPHLLKDVLREKWNFEGLIVSDYTSVRELVTHGIAADEKAAGEAAINAGLDMDMESNIFNQYALTSLREEKITEESINRSCRRVLAIKYDLGLFRDPYQYCDSLREKRTILKAEFQKLARELARKSIVLLKNDINTLPMSKEGQRIALIGPLATAKKEQLGAWSGVGEAESSISLLEGMQEKLGTAGSLAYAMGCGITDKSEENFEEAIALARSSDIIVFAGGEEALMSGEAASRSQLGLPGVQLELLKSLHALGKPIILVLMNGRPLTLEWESQHLAAIVESWYLGTQAGPAIADVLFGDYNPSGKLPMTFPRSTGQIPIYYNNKNTGRPASASKYSSKYLDISTTPLYPFGYGLSYTTFKYSEPQTSKDSYQVEEEIPVRFNLSNIGNREGEEIVQLYIQDPVAEITRPLKTLRRFQKEHLKPGESRRIEFILTAADFAYYHNNMELSTDSGIYNILVGPNSVALQQVQIQLLE